MFYVDDGDDNAEDYNNTLNIDVDVLREVFLLTLHTSN
jgi:hypothetical protein